MKVVNELIYSYDYSILGRALVSTFLNVVLPCFVLIHVLMFVGF